MSTAVWAAADARTAVVVRPLTGEIELAERVLGLRPAADGSAPDAARAAYDRRLLERALAAPDDARALVALAGARPAARLVAYADDRVRDAEGRPIGRFGLFAAENDPAAVRALVDAALDWLEALPAARRPARVVAPMDGDTWHDYRLRTAGFDQPAFPGEPDNPAYYPALLEAAGLAPVARFTTRTVAGAGIDRAMRRWAPAHARVLRRGFAFRRLGPGDAAAALALAHPLAHRVFDGNPLFTPLDAAAFAQRFLSDLGLGRGPSGAADPVDSAGAHAPVGESGWRLVVALEPSGEPAGLCLGYPSHGEPGAVVLKSFGVVPRRHGTALGPALAFAAYADWLASGAACFHHALMREGAAAGGLDRGAGVTTRAYALYGRPLDAAPPSAVATAAGSPHGHASIGRAP